MHGKKSGSPLPCCSIQVPEIKRKLYFTSQALEVRKDEHVLLWRVDLKIRFTFGTCNMFQLLLPISSPPCDSGLRIFSPYPLSQFKECGYVGLSPHGSLIHFHQSLNELQLQSSTAAETACNSK